MAQLQALVDAGHSVLLVEHDPRVVAQCDWVIDMGPGAGDEGGHPRPGPEPQRIVLVHVAVERERLAGADHRLEDRPYRGAVGRSGGADRHARQVSSHDAQGNPIRR